MGKGLSGGPGVWQICCLCTGVDAWECLPCPEEHPQSPALAKTGSRRRREVAPERLDELTKELFRLHDLNDNGLLEELELIKLNEKIAILHHGKDTDVREVREKYRSLFRSKLDPHGLPVPFEIFHAYTREMVDSLDTDPEAQEMILEQFVAEANSGRQAFDFTSLVSESDPPIWGTKLASEQATSTSRSTATHASLYPACSGLRFLSCCSRPKRSSSHDLAGKSA
mmetsp:Transcript_34939/g.99777  ORF Transcript_34939/g.99777 Transcript_34939/m.99777 type:complete len:226 (-) Transcript_34939:90-767(-)